MKTEKWFNNSESVVPNELALIDKEIETMAGTVAGGKAAAITNKKKYGEDFYGKIGAKGGAKGRTGGFWADRDLARRAGAKGGKISRRTSKKDKELHG